MTDHTIELYQDDDGEWRVRVDAPGERAVSAPVGDPFGFVSRVAQETGLDVMLSPNEGVLTITRPEPAPQEEE